MLVLLEFSFFDPNASRNSECTRPVRLCLPQQVHIHMFNEPHSDHLDDSNTGDIATRSLGLKTDEIQLARTVVLREGTLEGKNGDGSSVQSC